MRRRNTFVLLTSASTEYFVTIQIRGTERGPFPTLETVSVLTLSVYTKDSIVNKIEMTADTTSH